MVEWDSYNCKGGKVPFHKACYCDQQRTGLESIIKSDSVSVWALCPEIQNQPSESFPFDEKLAH